MIISYAISCNGCAKGGDSSPKSDFAAQFGVTAREETSRDAYSGINLAS
jgi:hypothetical protein